MSEVAWSHPVALESIYDSRVLRIDGEVVGTLDRWKRDDADPWTYAPNLHDDTRELGEFDDAWDAMVAMEVAVGVRPVGHSEAWGLPGWERERRAYDEHYGTT